MALLSLSESGSVENLNSQPINQTSTMSLPSSKKIQEVLSSIFNQIAQQELKTIDFSALVSRSYMKLTELDPKEKNPKFQKALEQRIAQEIHSTRFPIPPEILDQLILDEEWRGRILTFGLPRYVGRLIRPEIKKIGKVFSSFSTKQIKKIVTSTLSDPIRIQKIQLEFKNKLYENEKFRFSYLATACLQKIWEPICDNLTEVLAKLPQRHFTKQEISDLGLPGGRNMLKEFTQDENDCADYYRRGLESKIVKCFLAKEQDELMSKIETAVKKFIKKSQIQFV